MAEGILPQTPEFGKIIKDATEEANRDMHLASYNSCGAEEKAKNPRIDPRKSLAVCRQLLEEAARIYGEALTPPGTPRGPDGDDDYDARGHTPRSSPEEAPDYGGVKEEKDIVMGPHEDVSKYPVEKPGGNYVSFTLVTPVPQGPIPWHPNVANERRQEQERVWVIGVIHG